MFKRSLLILGFSLGGFCLGTTSVKAILIGGFNGAMDASWTGFGDVSATSGSFNGVNPTEGTGFLRITNASKLDEPGFNFSGTEPIPVGGGSSSVEGQINLPNGIFDLAGDFGFEGGAVRRTLSVGAGDNLVFDWNFLTTSSQPNFNDYGFLAVNQVGSTSVNLVNLGSTTFTSVFPGSPFAQRNSNGLSTSTFTFPTAGNYAIAFGVIDVNDASGASALFLDNVRVEPVPFEFDRDMVFGLVGFASFVMWQKLKNK
jgi:hypothetical protein